MHLGCSRPFAELVSTNGTGGGAVFKTPYAGTIGGAGFTRFGNINPGGSSFDRESAPGSANVGCKTIAACQPNVTNLGFALCGQIERLF